MSLLQVVVPLVERWRSLTLGSLVVGCAALAIGFAITPTYTAHTTFLPPADQESAASSLMASLGSFAGLAGVGGGRTPADQYVALMQSNIVLDRIIHRFGLEAEYGTKYHSDARKALSQSARFEIGKKDGLITLEVDDHDPKRAADIANQFVEELRSVTNSIAVTEAQRRRMFFEQELKRAQTRLTKAQQDLQGSGLTQGAIKVDPSAAAEEYAHVKGEVVAAQVRLDTMRHMLTDSSPEVLQQRATLRALEGQLQTLERSEPAQSGPDYVGKYREFKYQETLFDLFAKQYELAKIDESREGGIVQVVDPATPPEKKSKPKRAVIAVVATLLTFLTSCAAVILREGWHRTAQDPTKAEYVQRLRAALRLRRRVARH